MRERRANRNTHMYDFERPPHTRLSTHAALENEMKCKNEHIKN